ncbi:hypothetical protein L195_g049459 [Trifolium pratense]|uniref:Uncharacterized protein n=1 Tax=Trifolium pratense TaxID=57577 RepID=A0A2K3JP84_TRIPR|nr:hypothetical protein L195_g049459 [Trifolium pratense]
MADLGKYLGEPLLHSRQKNSTYEYLIDKIRKRLSSWKAGHLSFAGRHPPPSPQDKLVVVGMEALNMEVTDAVVVVAIVVNVVVVTCNASVAV